MHLNYCMGPQIRVQMMTFSIIAVEIAVLILSNLNFLKIDYNFSLKKLYQKSRI